MLSTDGVHGHPADDFILSTPRYDLDSLDEFNWDENFSQSPSPHDFAHGQMNNGSTAQKMPMPTSPFDPRGSTANEQPIPKLAERAARAAPPRRAVDGPIPPTPTSTNLGKRKRREADLFLACPIFQADIILGRGHSCSSAGPAKNMSDIRRHLLRGKKPHLHFLKSCKTCKKHVLHQQEYETRHGQHCGKVQPQRQSTETQWTLLFAQLYSDIENIPSPCK
ncbi:hypothetical protein BCR34DRAFT_239543 [Clohesyomyces aquaticus]|uniref:Uncharacterized protein n=1 Tax=Clohesyomyces aquaticus TaxID=1231657 RepID=A0A1Y1Y679_9PLEO|nr:hypothetical protein BCR34DRAFT_239543 [Clohesyomyces aquaticus]